VAEDVQVGTLDDVACFDFGLVGAGFADGGEYPCVRGASSHSKDSSASRLVDQFRAHVNL